MTSTGRASLIKVFSQADFDDFAHLSGDDNPIHTDPAFCAGARFGRPVAHGLLLCSVLRGLIDTLLPGRALSEQAVMFPAPTFADEPVNFTVTMSDTGQGCIDLELEAKRLDDDVVTCQGTAKICS
jgi:acyl dehydratase